MDREYFFLHKNGEVPTGLPDNIKLVPYGDDYSDLPEFLEDMAQERLKAKIENNPIIGRTITSQKADSYGLSEYHYSNEYLKFCGRKVELARLDNFAETDSTRTRCQALEEFYKLYKFFIKFILIPIYST